MKLVKAHWSPLFQYERQLQLFVKVAYHKADVVFTDGGDRRISKQCWSYRPEGQLWIGPEGQKGQKIAYAYFGMGTAASHSLTHNFVVFGLRLSALTAILEVLDSSKNLPVDV